MSAATTLACPHCNAANARDAEYCVDCGKDLRDPTARTTLHEAPPAPDPLLERLRHATLGDYDVATELGRGGMAAVYLAHDLSLDRKVAIKVMLPELTRGPEMVERFRREARTAANLSHPHIIPIYQVREVDGMVFFVMKFVEGRSLDSIVQERGALPVRMVETILAQTASALAYAHRKGIIHRDIKPANIMLDEDGWAVVTDFGIAKVSDASMLTTTGATMGTPYYMSPEQCSSKPVTGQSDQYSLGIAAYELLTGRPPFDGQNLMEVMSGHFFTPPPPIQQKRPECPTRLEEIVQRMIAKEPAERFPSLDDVVTALAMPALAHDDPIRSQMIELAKSGAALQARLSVPISPIPLGRPRPSAAGSAAGSAAVPSKAAPRPAVRPKRGLRQTMMGLGVLGLAIGSGYVAVNGVPETIPFFRAGAEPPSVTMPDPLPEDPDPQAASLAQDSSAAADSAARAREAEDAQRRADSLRLARFRADSVARARARVDSFARARAQADSIARADSVAAVQLRRAEAATRLVLGTSAAGAMLYIDGEPVDTISRPRARRIQSGTRRLSVVVAGCTPWDSTLTIAPGDTVIVGTRHLSCQ